MLCSEGLNCFGILFKYLLEICKRCLGFFLESGISCYLLLCFRDLFLCLICVGVFFLYMLDKGLAGLDLKIKLPYSILKFSYADLG